MSVPQSEVTAYLQMAAALYDGRLDEADLSAAAAALLPLDHQLLEYLATTAAEAAYTQPKYGWALTAVADAAAARERDTFLQALAAWHLARAANAWVQPGRVETAVGRARAGFAALDLPGWLAACDWQENVEPWLCNDFHQAVTDLQQACVVLQQHGMPDFSWQCRLSLAYAHILLGQFEVAEEHIDRCEQTFAKQGDINNLVVSCLHRASSLRRQKRFPEAIASLQKGLTLLEDSRPILQAKINAQLAYCQLEYANDYQAAERLFFEAAAQFEASEIELWDAFCLNGLTQVYNNIGRLTAADRLLKRVKIVYDKYEIIGLQADNAIERGGQAFYRGDWVASVNFFQQAETKFKQLKIPYMAAMASLYAGDAYGQANHYLRALHAYENALQKFEKLQDEWRMAECKVRLAKVWIDLQRPLLAQRYLQEAVALFERVQQLNWLVTIFLYQARIFVQENAQAQAVAVLERALELAKQIDNPVQTARVQHTFGAALSVLRLPERTEGEELLQTAAATFAATGMTVEEAAVYVALGYHYQQTGKWAAAQAAWEKVLTLNRAALPDIAWRAYGGLGLLAEKRQQYQVALAHYEHAARILARMRRDLWQPALAGTYLAQPAAMLARAVTLAGEMGSAQHAVTFIEAGKAHHATGARSTVGLEAPQPPRLVELGAEIRWLQEQILDVKVADAGEAQQMRELNRRLVEKAQAYDQLAAQVERSQFAWQEQKVVNDGVHAADDQSVFFDANRMREWANRRLQPAWLALNYYLTDTHVIGTALTPETVFVWLHALTPAVHLALRILTQKPRLLAWPWRHLVTLGDWLLPQYIQERLTPQTYLLLAPHRQLHRLPWAALLVGKPRRHLAAAAVAVVVPSWHSLMALWQQPPRPSGSLKRGLVVAISDFNGRHNPLQQAAPEAEALQNLYAGSLTRLQDVTAAQLAAFAQENPLADFDFLHIVSHAFVDELTGRLSGIALLDRDLWLDEIPPLGPLPETVVLSACRSNVGRFFAGDEQLGLAATCLEAGAQRVVGSLWPVLDRDMPRLMAAFYRHLHAGMTAAGALAQAQREMLVANLPAVQWSGFTLIGQP